MIGDPLSVQICLLEGALPELFAQVTQSGRLTTADRYGILAALLQAEALTDEEKFAIDRMLFAISRGRVQIVDEVSAIDSGVNS
jgi:hypothetical protein